MPRTYPDGHNEVCLWPPEDEDTIWMVIVVENGKRTEHEIDGYEESLARAKAEADRLGVVGWVPTNDGEARDL